MPPIYQRKFTTTSLEYNFDSSYRNIYLALRTLRAHHLDLLLLSVLWTWVLVAIVYLITMQHFLDNCWNIITLIYRWNHGCISGDCGYCWCHICGVCVRNVGHLNILFLYFINAVWPLYYRNGTSFAGGSTHLLLYILANNRGTCSMILKLF